MRRTAAAVPARCLSLAPAKTGFSPAGRRPAALFTRLRAYSVLTQNAAKEYKYRDVKALTEARGGQPGALLIDVREPSEFQEGHIPGARNVPFKSSPGAFDLSEEEFEESFGFEKPAKDQHLVFYCLGGVRLTAAEELANSFGYTNRGNYVGSWEDWVAHENAAGKA
ncbi:Rhodanese-like protein [Metschnikowia bicuspidata var. bicuspidata NRRL YB-4993]|uniref:Rhodanese-like protein n=1 Tax=Metschnikowia bicuspidata var. bicuspidata NRRL YB-4993 TaxID=869754 RepID=A0A1A0HBY3_9ASCO|nr:Rhodanese-like protein [Metschnikowia bicuspidata var. bicuspidata NRRL YB-4993]OBA21521.1 Rhodanese-like protein [Metschnikowia bicuspidata var. bicuspidata NRRL YB-4993]